MGPRSLEENKKHQKVHCWLEHQALCSELTAKCKFFDVKYGCLIAAFLKRKNLCWLHDEHCECVNDI